MLLLLESEIELAKFHGELCERTEGTYTCLVCVFSLHFGYQTTLQF